MTDRDKAEICWNCSFWRCPSWHDPQSHKCPSMCMGRCKKHNERREATDTCEEWMVRINTPTQIGYCLSVQAAAVFASVREYLEKSAKPASDFTTPVIDALTQNAPAGNEEVTEAMIDAGLASYYGSHSHEDICEEIGDSFLRTNMCNAYAAMRAARPPAQMSPPDNRLDQILAGVRRLEDATFGCGPTPTDDRVVTDAVFSGICEVLMVNFSTIEPDMAETVTAQILDAMRAARVPAPTPELSTELATLRRITAALLDDLPINEWRFAARNGNDVVLGYVAVREIAPLLEALDEAEEED